MFIGLLILDGKSLEPMDLNERIERVRQENHGVRVDCYVLFSSHTDAMELHELAHAAGLGARVSTTPRQARSSCGVALLVSCDEAAAIGDVAQAHNVPIEGIVPLPNQINPKRDVYC